MKLVKNISRAIAQLVARMHGVHEVASSSLASPTDIFRRSDRHRGSREFPAMAGSAAGMTNPASPIFFMIKNLTKNLWA